MDLVAWSRVEAEARLSPLGSRWAHTLGVVHRAKGLAGTAPAADRETLIAAAYVHDVGYAPELEDTGFHPLDGARWLRSCGHERLARLVAHHSGARFEAEARGLVDELDMFPEERSVVADLLTYCDLTTDPDGHQVTLSARLAGIDSRYARDSDVSRGMRTAAGRLAALVRRAEREIARSGTSI
ncbi:HD domain-containing protein [Solirubrobacter ginsenosidimutans]|uniref:HD domain-containing protein n=1 Tax=Solirubrobacter ginsenosidimutans TaxID=490573 RepID=A0A9X3MQN8_9ACTN|nr:HD domain-containing protein [Solirubrobacter ginsenosidimutans]MDA0160660.1 HD domain-containing protein [Solirubrobacter ginsenosidimutans]